MRKKHCGIYVITCCTTGKRYVGSSRDIQMRLYGHRCQLRKKKHHSIHLQRAWDLYGESNFTFSTIEFCDPGRLAAREQFYVDAFKSGDRESGYNIQVAIERHEHSLETRKKISESKKGRKLGPLPMEVREKLSAANKGHVVSEETRRKISEKRRGQKLSSEHRQRLSEAMRRVIRGPLSGEHKEKIKQAHLGRHFTTDTLAKMSSAQKKRFSKSDNNRNHTTGRFQRKSLQS